MQEFKVEFIPGVHSLWSYEKEVILKRMEFYKGNRTQVAKSLEVSFVYLSRKLYEYGKEAEKYLMKGEANASRSN